MNAPNAPFPLAVCAALAACGEPVPHDLWSQTVTLSGVAFRFEGGAPQPDAEISLAELPEARTTSDAQGRFALEIPVAFPVTPLVEHPDFRTMHLQTFTALDRDFEDVKFQMVSPAIYDLFAAVLAVDADPRRCQIATTVSTDEIQGLDHEAFVAFGAHGVAGAVGHTSPEIPDMVYFDARTIPDRTLTETTLDGGIVWPNVEPGVYAISATHPARAFDRFVATCEPGRFVNAGPPWGLRER